MALNYEEKSVLFQHVEVDILNMFKTPSPSGIRESPAQLDSDDEDATATTPDTLVTVSPADVLAGDWVMLGLPRAEHTMPTEHEDMHRQVLEFVELWKDLAMKRRIDALDRRLNASWRTRTRRSASCCSPCARRSTSTGATVSTSSANNSHRS